MEIRRAEISMLHEIMLEELKAVQVEYTTLNVLHKGDYSSIMDSY